MRIIRSATVVSEVVVFHLPRHVLRQTMFELSWRQSSLVRSLDGSSPNLDVVMEYMDPDASHKGNSQKKTYMVSPCRASSMNSSKKEVSITTTIK